MKDKIEKLKILLKRVGRESEFAEVENTLEAKQKLVNGLIEVVPLEQDEDLLIVCNEEGKLLSLPPNTLFDFDYIAGDYFIIGDDYENGDFKSITEEQFNKIKPFIDSKSFKYEDKAIERFDMQRFKREMIFLTDDLYEEKTKKEPKAKELEEK